MPDVIKNINVKNQLCLSCFCNVLMSVLNYLIIGVHVLKLSCESHHFHVHKTWLSGGQRQEVVFHYLRDG